MQHYSTQINALLSDSEVNKIIKDIWMKSSYHDEPRFFLCSSILNIKSPYEISAAGLSFASSHVAILKCVGETIERYCTYSYRKSSIIFSSYDSIEGYALDPGLFEDDSRLRKGKLGWIKGFNLTDNINSFIPAQLVYLNYKKANEEIQLPQPNVSTGAAGGFDHASTLLRGIYEVVERDSFMNIYLNKISAPKIDLNSLNDKIIKKILASCERYGLEVNVFDITTDLGIPTFVSLVIDKSGIGPSVSCGAKASLRANEALVGGVTESFLTRGWIRTELLKTKLKQPKHITVKPAALLQRGLFWSSPRKIELLDFLLKQPTMSVNYSDFKGDAEEELARVVSILKKKGHTVYYTDITLPNFKKVGYLVYKVIIPTLQPLYLDEGYKILRLNRLKETAIFFGKKKFSLNRVPHPFL